MFVSGAQTCVRAREGERDLKTNKMNPTNANFSGFRVDGKKNKGGLYMDPHLSSHLRGATAIYSETSAIFQTDTPVGNPLCDTIVQHSSGRLLLDIILRHFCLTFFYGAMMCETLLGHPCG